MSEEEELSSAEATDSMAAFSDKLNELSDSLDILYISKNPGGRHRFREKWPEVAEYLFSPELIHYDVEGVEDKEHRKKLEDDACDRRIMLKVTIAEIIDKSVDAGSLQFDYVGKVIEQYGAGLSLFLYAEGVIERVRPGLLGARGSKSEELEQVKQSTPSDDMGETTKVSNVSEDLRIDKNDDMGATTTFTEEENEQTSAPDEKLSSEEKSLLSNNPDIIDDVKPIETPVPQLNNPEKIEEQMAPVLPPLPEETKPLEKNEQAQQKHTAPPVVEGVPDILKPPKSETPSAPVVDEKKVKEMTLPQATKAEKGVYLAMFNALASAA